MLHNQVAAILLLFAVISGRGKKSRKFAMDSSVTVFVQHGRKIKYRGATALKKNFIKWVSISGPLNGLLNYIRTPMEYLSNL